MIFPLFIAVVWRDARRGTTFRNVVFLIIQEVIIQIFENNVFIAGYAFILKVHPFNQCYDISYFFP